MKSSYYVLALCLSLGFVMISCGDDDFVGREDIFVNANLEVQMRVGEETLNEGDSYTINGTAIQIDVARFYLGNITLTPAQDTVPIDLNTYRIVSPDYNLISLGSINSDSYGVSFGIGVDPVNNDQTTEDFASRPASDPLGAQEPAMHWNWNSGYKFLRIDAIVDKDGDGVVDTPVQYHLGSDPYFSLLTAVNSVDISEDNNLFLLRFDLEELLDGVDIANEEGTHVMDNVPLAQTILGNYKEAFSIRN